MIECIFTLDYELHGNGQGSLLSLVYEPAARLKEIFLQANARFVVFAEVAELTAIESGGGDPALGLVKAQLRQFHRDGFEIGLHLHPQWFNARRENGTWILDDGEYNLCLLSPERIEWILERSLAYLRQTLNEPAFIPTSFRAGNWLLQPTQRVAATLAAKGIKVDSSVFKGGLQRSRGLDYRPALQNGYYWRFEADVNVATQTGRLLEIPTYTRQVPCWQMLTDKRLAAQRKTRAAARSAPPGPRQRWACLRDRLRLHYPLKLDFCRMTFDELCRSLEAARQDDRENSEAFKPLVAIGHTKDLDDPETVVKFIKHLQQLGIKVSTFAEAFTRCQRS